MSSQNAGTAEMILRNFQGWTRLDGYDNLALLRIFLRASFTSLLLRL